jgi:molybdopterin/thiamine biosynthesis adenylyltransferase/rhodanese-related sulfurtransferase
MMLDFTQDELRRYARQFSLPQVGLVGQQKLKNTSILCVGAGGIGSPVLYYLAAAGIGKIGIIDDDKVELSNLQRQILYTTADCGRPKTEVAKERLLAINSNIYVNTYQKKLNVDNIFDVLPDYQMVIDGSDNFPTRYLVNDACYVKKTILISASLFQFTGQLVTLPYPSEDAACYRCLYPSPPPPGLIQNCVDAGIMGSVAGILGTMAATQAIKLAFNLDNDLRNQLLVFDGLTFDIKKYSYNKQKDCILCGKNMSFNELPRYMENVCATPDQAQVTPNQLNDYLKQQQKVLIIDVRSAWERNICAIPGSIHIPVEEFEKLDLKTVAFEENDRIILYCKAGIRSEKVASFLKEKGIKNVYSLKGGIVEWMSIVNKETLIY